MTNIDPKDAGTVVDMVVEDQFVGPCQCPQQVVVVRVRHHLRRRADVLEAEGHRVRRAAVDGARPPHQLANQFTTFAASYTLYDATRIERQLAPIFRNHLHVRISTVRALMKSVRLPAVKETTQYEEAL